jgi:hypothetical protein
MFDNMFNFENLKKQSEDKINKMKEDLKNKKDMYYHKEYTTYNFDTILKKAEHWHEIDEKLNNAIGKFSEDFIGSVTPVFEYSFLSAFLDGIVDKPLCCDIENYLYKQCSGSMLNNKSYNWEKRDEFLQFLIDTYGCKN